MSATPFFSPATTTKSSPNTSITIEQIKATLDETAKYCRLADNHLPQIQEELVEIDHELGKIEDGLKKIKYRTKTEETANDDFEDLLKNHNKCIKFLGLLEDMFKTKLGDNNFFYQTFTSNYYLRSIVIEKDS